MSYLIPSDQSLPLRVPLEHGDGLLVAAVVGVGTGGARLTVHGPARYHACDDRKVVAFDRHHTISSLSICHVVRERRHIPSSHPMARVLSDGCQSNTVASTS